MPTKNIKLIDFVKPNSMHAVLRETLQRLNEEDVDPKAEDEMEKAFTDAVNKSVTDFDAVGKEAEKKMDDEATVTAALKKAPELEKIANECLRRRNKALVEGDLKKQRLNEEPILLAASIAIAIPRIVELIGKLVKVITIALGGKGSVGEKMAHAGHKWHENIIKVLTKGISKIPGLKKLPPEKQEKIAKVFHMLVVASLAVASGVGAVEAAKQGANTLSGIEAALVAVKAGELGMGKFISAAIAKIIA